MTRLEENREAMQQRATPAGLSLSSLPPIPQGINPEFVFARKARVADGLGYSQVR